MSIIPRLKNPNDLLLKLCRESINVYTSKQNEEVLDRFFNFCVTAHSLRDWTIKGNSLNQHVLHEYCNEFDSLRMCRDIANASKHFSLDEEKVSSVAKIDEKELSYRPMVSGKIDSSRNINKPSLEVCDVNGNRFQLKDFMNVTIETWFGVFDHFEIKRDENPFYTRTLEIKVGDYVVSLF